MGERYCGEPELLRQRDRQIRLHALHPEDAAPRRQARGQAGAEVALPYGRVFLLVMGIFDFGRAIAVYINIAEAAHEGARQLVLRSNYSSTPPDSVIINATLAKIGGGGLVLAEDRCLSNPH